MREFVSPEKLAEIRQICQRDENCCLIDLEGSKLKNKYDYYEELGKQLQLNDSFNHNFNAYSDMMCDPYTYYNKEKIVFLIDEYEKFLSEDYSLDIIEEIFDEVMSPFFRESIESLVQYGIVRKFHIYCVDRKNHKA